LATLKSRH